MFRLCLLFDQTLPMSVITSGDIKPIDGVFCAFETRANTSESNILISNFPRNSIIYNNESTLDG